MEQTIYSIFRNIKKFANTQPHLLASRKNEKRTSDYYKIKIQRILQSNIVRVRLCFHHGHNSWCWLHTKKSIVYEQAFELVKVIKLNVAIQQLIQSKELQHYEDIETFESIDDEGYKYHLVKLYQLG